MTSLSRAALAQFAERSRAEYERALRQLVEIPTVSSDPSHGKDMARGAEAAAHLVRAAGGRARVIRTGGHPVVLGDFPARGGAPTVVLYNHLDVQPAAREAEGWRTEPFRFVRRGDRYFGRGTTDDKGPAVAALFGVRAAREAGVPVGVRLLWEMEEEIGSPSLEPVLGRLATKVPPHSVVVSDAAWLDRRRPTSISGLRGFIGFRFVLDTAEGEAHSGDVGGAARNPLAELMQLVSQLHDARTGRVKVPGFYDDVTPLRAADREEFRRSGFSLAGYRRDNHLRLLRTSDPVEVLERIWARPTFEVHGLVGGYTGPGIKATVPGHAEVKVSCRLVPRQKPETIARLITKFVRAKNPDVVVHAEGAALPYEGSSVGPVADAVRSAISFAFGRTPAFVRDGGTIGALVSMGRILRCPVAFLNLSLPEHGYHAPNENFDWGQAAGGMAAFARYLEAVADAAPLARR
ncbi:MAG TPA: M20/M25/M40 family metallo-hydrolase [Vicinamibacteria bacterium]|nr:M20/M25/M40 family metallo-hydrolase [Vicinamibacteria bacterium]